MNNHQKRILLGGFFAVAVLVAIFLLLPKPPLVIASFCMALLAPIMFCVGLWQLSSGGSREYITNTAFVFEAGKYALLNLIMCAVAVLIGLCLPSMEILAWIFVLLQLILMSWFGWRFLAMSSGQELIQQADKNVKARTCQWKLLLADAESIVTHASAEGMAMATEVRDAIRFSDPMSCPEVAGLETAIGEQLKQFGESIQGGKQEAKEQAASLLRAIQDRNTKVKLLK